MLSTIFAVLPVFLVLGTGYVSVRAGYLPVTVAAALNAYVVRIAVPLLLFRSMLELDMSSAFDPGMLGAFYSGAFGVFVIGYLLARGPFGRQPSEAVAVAFAAFFSNTLMLGLPIIERAFGGDALTFVFGIIAFHAPVLYTVGMIAMELTRKEGRSVARTFVSGFGHVLANPLMIGIVLGLGANALDLPLPEFVIAAVDLLAQSAIPAALIGIGASLTQYRLKSDLKESLVVASLSLIVHPAITLIVGILIGLPQDRLIIATVLASMSPGMNIYIFAVMYDRAVRLAASSVLVGTSFAVVTVTAWIWVLTHWP